MSSRFFHALASHAVVVILPLLAASAGSPLSAQQAGSPDPKSAAAYVRIPASGASVTFVMGDSLKEGEVNERPARTVQLSAFAIARTEVTWREWKAVRTWAVKHGYTDLEEVGTGKADEHPVHTISWWDAIKWCNAKSEMEAAQGQPRTPCYYTDATNTTVLRTTEAAIAVSCRWDAQGYRLPTEAEWECAARGGAAGRRFPWVDSDEISHQRANYMSREFFSYDTSGTRGAHPAYATGAKPYTSPVGSFTANGFGLHDMAGNVWEWCWDWHGDAYYTGRPDPDIDPRGPSPGRYMAIRGGGWYGYAVTCRIAYRRNLVPNGYEPSVGFRPVLGIVP